MATHGFGIVGCGMIAEFHARAIAEIPGASLVAAFRADRRRTGRRSPACPSASAGSMTTSERCSPIRGSTSSASARRAAPTLSRRSRRPGRASMSWSRSPWRSPSLAATPSSGPATRRESGSARSSRRGSRPPTGPSRRRSTRADSAGSRWAILTSSGGGRRSITTPATGEGPGNSTAAGP